MKMILKHDICKFTNNIDCQILTAWVFNYKTTCACIFYIMSEQTLLDNIYTI
jgi:hypothetical protein